MTATTPPASRSAADARSQALTVLGDLVLPSGGHVRLGGLAGVMGLLDVPADATGAALEALAAQGIVEPSGPGGDATAWALTNAGRRRLEEAAERIYLRRPLVWDGRWRLLSHEFDDAATAPGLARELEWLGYGRLRPSLWICPWDLGARLEAVLAKHGVAGLVESFVSEHAGDDRALAREAYNLSGLFAAHRAFIDRFGDELVEVRRGGPPDDDAALARRLRLVHEWRKFLFADPGLPAALTPGDWLGARAAEVFAELYAAYEQPAWRAWERIAAAADPRAPALRRPHSNLDAGQSASATGPGASYEQRVGEFRERLAAGHKVEAGDWMPDEYRRLALKFIEMHANSEIMGALPEREWISRAPTLRRKRSLAAKVQDEVGHAHLIYRVAEDLGKSRAQMFDDLIAGRTKFHNVFHYPVPTWGDVAVIGFLVDGAAIVTQRALLATSYAPYLRVMRRVVAEESLHYRHGEDITLALASGTNQQFEMLQDAVTRWWTPIMHFFGHDTPAEKDLPLVWGIKTRTNEESRQEFLSQYVPKMWAMGIEIPDPALAWQPEEQRWRYTEPDWDEMDAIIRGEGPMTEARLGLRGRMRESHAWLREAVSGEPAAA